MFPSHLLDDHVGLGECRRSPHEPEEGPFVIVLIEVPSLGHAVPRTTIEGDAHVVGVFPLAVLGDAQDCVGREGKWVSFTCEDRGANTSS